MKLFDYYSPKTVKEALEILDNADENTYMIAGGTDIMLNLHSEKIEPERVININAINELRYVNEENGIIRIGALSNFESLTKDKLLKENVKILVEVCKVIGSVQIRNLGTIGGNIITASPAADSVAALVALDATLVIQGQWNKREVKIIDFYDNGIPNINKNEMLTEIFFEKPNSNTFTTFTKLTRRKAVDIVVLSMGAVIESDNEKKCIKAQFSLGAVSRNPIRLYEIEENLLGKTINRENLEVLIDEMPEIISNSILKGAPWMEEEAYYKSRAIRGVAGETFNKILSKIEN